MIVGWLITDVSWTTRHERTKVEVLGYTLKRMHIRALEPTLINRNPPRYLQPGDMARVAKWRVRDITDTDDPRGLLYSTRRTVCDRCGVKVPAWTPHQCPDLPMRPEHGD